MASRLDLDFSAVVDEVKKIEKRAENCIIDPTWAGPINFSIDFSPREYDEWQFTDVLHLYRAISRIQRLQAMKLGTKTEETSVSKSTEDTKIQPSPIQPIPQPSSQSIPPTELKEEKEEPPVQQQPEENEELEKLLKELSPKTQSIQEGSQNIIEIDEKKTEELLHQSPVISIPEFLKEDPLKKAEEELEKQLSAGKVVKINPKEIREKMVELTKMLFKEQNAVKRKKIKEELSMLRVMLKKKSASDNKDLLSKSLEKSQKEELLNAKDTIFRTWRRAMSSVIHNYLSVLTSTSNDEVRKKAKKLFFDDINSVKEQSINLINTYCSFLSKKHGEEWEILGKKLGSSAINIDEKKKYVNEYVKNKLEKFKSTFTKRADEIKGLTDEQLKSFIQVMDMDLDELMNKAKSIQEANEFMKAFEKRELSKEELLFHLRWILKDVGKEKSNELDLQYQEKEGLDVGQNS